MYKNKIWKQLAIVAAAFLMLVGSTKLVTQAAVKDQGTDWSIYQSALGKTGYKDDKFSISQIGGVTANGIYNQSTYKTQIASGTALGLRMHTYVWWQDVYSNTQAKQVLDYFFARVQTPKHSIIALDAEAGYQNTAILDYALSYIKSMGYTPVLYGYKNNLVNHTNLKYLTKYPLWLAEYPDYQVRRHPNYNYFPSYDNVQIFQFTSTYVAGGLDGNVDLSGITDNGYTKADKPKTTTPAISNGKQAAKTPVKDVKVGDTVNVNLSAKKWATGQTIISAVKGKSYKVIQKSGNRILLDKVMSWISKSDVRIVVLNNPIKTVTNQPKPVTSSSYTVHYGDTLSAIAYKYGTTVSKLQLLNGISNPNLITIGQRILVTGSTNKVATHTYYTVHYGDFLSTIAYKYGTTYTKLQKLNHLSNPNYIYVGQRLMIK